MRELREWKLACPKDQLDVCFPTATTYQWIGRTSLTFLAAIRRANLRRIRIHDLRHGAASCLLATGMDIAYASRQLGHAIVAIMLSTYAHLVPSRAETDHTSKLEANLAE
jgi:integrase